MTGLNHNQARRYLRLAADGLLRGDQRRALETHLHDCASCRLEAENLQVLETNLKKIFHSRWDTVVGPSISLETKVSSQTRRLIMSYRIKMGLKFLAGAALLLGLALAVNLLFSRLKTSPATSTATFNALPTGLPATASATPRPYNGLIAFGSEKSGYPEIYTMRADGSAVTALTSGPGKNSSLAWSPDGKRIAFINETNGNAGISIMNADGSEQAALTNAPNSDISFKWSPDGRKIAYSASDPADSNSVSLYVVNIDGTEAAILIDGLGTNSFAGWSPDSQRIVYTNANPQSSVDTTVYIVNADGSNRQELAQPTGIIKIMGWQDAYHFYAISNNIDLWELFRVSTDGTLPEKIASYQNESIQAWFQSNNNFTYVTNYFATWTWYRLDGTNPIYLATWPNYAFLCQKYIGNPIMGGAFSQTSPDGSYGLVSVACDDDDSSTPFYLVSNDGSYIKPLFDVPIPSQIIDVSWSPDGQYIVVNLGNNQTGKSDLYRIDLERTLQDPSLHPIQLTTDNAWKYDAVWQPQP